SVALANTIEVQSLSGRTVGLIVLPLHPIRVAWHIAYDNLVLYAAFEENLKGSLAAGKLADYVVLEKNIFEIPASEIRQVNVLRTVVGGKVVFEKAAR
ncbi:MAG: amidohydrolase family protein, partial [Chitinophagaceae bacterium]|nr:amidohydrolase family protein [Chitinophagaceae bacterium]